MAKERKFTDIELEICGKKCHFNRVTNKELTQFSERVETDFNKVVKAWSDKAEDLTFEGEKLEKEIARKEKKLELLELKETPDVDELLKVNDELEALELRMNELTKELMKHNNNNPNKKYSEIVDKSLGDKVELLVDNISAKEFIENSTPRDSSIARNLEKYYQMAMMGERHKKIEVAIDEDMERFLKEQQELRERE